MIDPETEALAAETLQAAREAGLRIACAESCTGGLVMGALTAVAGSSDVVEGGFVTYSNFAKIRALGVPVEEIRKEGAVSEGVAKEMVEGVLAKTRAHLAVSLTGVAGPGGSPTKPEGMVCFGLALRGAPTITQEMRFGEIGRGEVRRASVHHALRLLRDAARAAKAEGYASGPLTPEG